MVHSIGWVRRRPVVDGVDCGDAGPAAVSRCDEGFGAVAKCRRTGANGRRVRQGLESDAARTAGFVLHDFCKLIPYPRAPACVRNCRIRHRGASAKVIVLRDADACAHRGCRCHGDPL